MKLIYLLAFGLIIAAPQHPAQAQSKTATNAQRERDASAVALVRLVAVQLGDATWDVEYEPQFDLIKVKSRQQFAIEQPVFPGQPALASQFVEGEPVLAFTHLEIWLRIKPFVSPAENAKVEAQLAPMATQLKSIEGKPESFWPRNSKEKQLVEKYRRTKAELRDLPKFYFENVSLDITFFIYGHPISLSDETEESGELPQWRRQQKEAALSIAKLLTRYEPVAT